MADTVLGSQQAYHRLHNVSVEKAQKMAKNLLTGYTFWFDKMFARGIMGLIFGLWTLALGVYNLLQFIEATSGSFLITFILTCVELGVVVVFTGILAYLSVRVDDDKKRLRVIASFPSVQMPAKDLINHTRSRGNVVSDFDLVAGTGLFFILFEFVVVLVFYVGNNFLLSDSAAVPSILAANDVQSVKLYVLAKIIYGVMLVKAAIVLGQAIKHAIADSFESLRLKQEAKIDSNKVMENGNDVMVGGKHAIQLSSVDAAIL